MIYKAVDIQDYAAVEDAVKSSVQELGQIDILVNNVRPPSTIPANLTKTGRPRSRRPLRIPRPPRIRHPNHEQHQHQRPHVRHTRRPQRLNDHPQSRHNPQHHLRNRSRGPPIPGRSSLSLKQGGTRGVYECVAQRAERNEYPRYGAATGVCGDEFPFSAGWA